MVLPRLPQKKRPSTILVLESKPMGLMIELLPRYTVETVCSEGVHALFEPSRETQMFQNAVAMHNITISVLRSPARRIFHHSRFRLKEPNLQSSHRDQHKQRMSIGRAPRPLLTKLKSLHTGSLGCAPTPNQYFVRLVSSWISLYLFCFRGRPVISSIVSGSAFARGTRGVGS